MHPKNLLKSCILTIVLLLSGTVESYAQASLSGQIKDGTTKENLLYCTASVYNMADSLITGAITNDKGFFEIPLQPGPYKLVCSYIGYYSDTLQITQGYDNNFIGAIYLKQNASELEELKVEGSLSEFNIDKDVQLITTDLRLGAANTADVLGRLKGVSYDVYNSAVKVDGDQNLIMLVNGLEKNQDYIKNLAPERVKEVEIIRNPTGRYALEGYTAVINIILKTNYRGTELYAENLFMYDIDTKSGKYLPINNTSATFNYTQDKLNFYVTGINNFTNIDLTNEAWRSNSDSILLENLASDGSNNMLVDNVYNSYTVGVDYYFNPKHTLSFESNISALPKSSEKISYSQQVNTYYNDLLVDSYTYDAATISHNGAYTGSLFYIYKKDDKSQLKADFTFSTYNNEYTNSIIQGNGFERYEDGFSTKSYSNFYLQYDHELNSKSSILVGYGNTWRKIKNNYTTSTIAYAGEEMIYGSSEFDLVETRNKLYAYYSLQLNKKLGLKLGAATEYSHPKSTYLDRTYFIVKPHADFFIAAHKMLSIKLKYRTYLNYPNINQTNPFVSVIDPYTVQGGNPQLRPELVHFVSSKFRLLQGLVSFEPYYNYSNNYITRTIEPLTSGLFQFSYSNVGTYKKSGIKGDLTIPLLKNSLIIQSQVDIFQSSITYNEKVNKVSDFKLNSKLIYVHKKSGGLAGLILQKNMVKMISAQGYAYGDNDYWLFFTQYPFFKKKMTVMIGYMLPLDLIVGYDQASFSETELYQASVSTSTDVLKNMFLVKFTYRFSKGKTVKDLKKDLKNETEKDSGGFF